jgi:addiction module HigA family antidote
MARRLGPISPGEILLEEFLRPLGIDANHLAREIGVPVSDVAEIIGGTRCITADTTRRLGQYFGAGAEMWRTLQSQYELRISQRIPSNATIAAIAQLDASKGRRSTASTRDIFDARCRQAAARRDSGSTICPSTHRT